MSYQDTCEWCGGYLEGRRNKRFCTRNCKRSALRARRRREERSNYLAGTVTPSEARDADERFHAAMAASHAAEEDRATRAALERTWQEFERRNPGVEHPGRTADRLQRQAADRADRAPKFTTPTVGELGRANRRGAPIRAKGAGPEWDDNDPDMMEPPSMIDLGNWRRGRKW